MRGTDLPRCWSEVANETTPTTRSTQSTARTQYKVRGRRRRNIHMQSMKRQRKSEVFWLKRVRKMMENKSVELKPSHTMSQTCASSRAVYKLQRSEGEVKCERKAGGNAVTEQQSLNSVSLL